MNIISLNIREWCGIHSNGIVDKDDCDELRAIADRIDREMVELPKDADGEPIHIGDVVYGNAGVAWTVVSLRLFKSGWKVEVNNSLFYRIPENLTHKEPEPADSWEKLEEDAASGVACDYVLEMIARAKKLAGIEEEATE